MRKFAWLVAASLLLLIFAAGSARLSTAADPGEGTTAWAEALSASCASTWVETREAIRRSGAPDGEARRHADLAREECERPLMGAAPSPRDSSPCAEDAERRNAPGPRGGRSAAVYFSCMADVGTKQQPVYRFIRPVEPSTDLARGLKSALLVYLNGPTNEEKQLGYMTAIPTPFPGALQRVLVDGPLATVSFTPALEERVGALPSAAAEAFLLELRATVFQFQEIERLALDVAGDCQRFGRLLETSCLILERSR